LKEEIGGSRGNEIVILIIDLLLAKSRAISEKRLMIPLLTIAAPKPNRKAPAVRRTGKSEISHRGLRTNKRKKA